MSLGYSLGDFIAGANMTYRLIRALSETKGACMEYQEAMSELGSLQQTFLQVGHLRPSDTLSQATINAAAYIVLSSVELIGEFLRKTQKYRQRFSRARTGNAVSDSWQKMGWVLFKREELRALRDALHLRLTNIGVLLSTAQIHGKIPLVVAQFEDKNSEKPSYSEGHATKGTDIGVSVSNDHKIGKLPLSIARFEETKPEHSVHSEDHAVEIERPRIEKLPSISTETTQPDTRSSDLATISLEMSDEGDLPSKEAYVEPIKDSEPVKPSLEVRNGRPPSINGAIVGRKGPDPKFPSHSAQALQPSAFTAIRSYAKVDGKWVIPNEERNNTPSGGQKPTRNSTEASRSETRTGVRFLDNVTGDQSFPLPEPNREFATASSEIDSNISQNNPNIQAIGPTTGIKKVNGVKLLSQLEHFLKENGSLRSDKMPIKFKDAVGRKFSFPFELVATWSGMQELIRQAFLHVNRIGQRVAEGHYDLIGPNGEIILPKVWETTIEPGWSISMHMWPMPEPSRPHIGHWRNPGPPPPPPPMPESPGAALPSRARPVSPPAIVHLTRGPPRSRHSKSKARGWMRKANKLFSTKDRDEYSDSDSFSSRSSVTVTSLVKKR